MNNVAQLKQRNQTKHGDEDGTDAVSSELVQIKAVDNGWMITTMFEDGSEVIEVFDKEGADDGDLQALSCIIESLGLEQAYKVSKR